MWLYFYLSLFLFPDNEAELKLEEDSFNEESDNDDGSTLLNVSNCFVND